MIHLFRIGANLIIIYVLTLIIFPSISHAQTPLTCGQVVGGTTSSPTEEHDYTFTVNADDVIRITAARTAQSFDPYLRLYDSSMTLIDFDDAGLNRAEITKKLAGGDYTLRVSDRYSDETGSYDVKWDKLNAPCTGSTSISCGQAAIHMLEEELFLPQAEVP